MVDAMDNLRARLRATARKQALGLEVGCLDREDDDPLMDEAITPVPSAETAAPLSLPASPDNSSLPSLDTLDPGEAVRMLDNIRLGQPVPLLMPHFSSLLDRVTGYLDTRFSRGLPTVKLVLGEMGMGKTTLARTIREVALGAGVVPVYYSMPNVGRGTLGSLVSMMLAGGELYQAAFERISKLALEGDTAALAKIRAAAFGHRTHAVLETLMHRAVVAGEVGLTLPAEAGKSLGGALGAWLQGGVSTPLAEQMVHGQGRRPVLGKFEESEAQDLLRAHLAFFAACGVHPVWLVDEFESIRAFQSRYLQAALGFFRDVIDVLMSGDDVAGSLIVFSTGDGAAAIASYPALNDRLRGAARFTLSSPSWEVKEFTRWDGGKVADTLETLYLAAAEAGDPAALAVQEHRACLQEPQYRELVKWVAEDARTEARVRLKSLVVNTIDLLESGPEVFAATVAESWRMYAEMSATPEVLEVSGAPVSEGGMLPPADLLLPCSAQPVGADVGGRSSLEEIATRLVGDPVAGALSAERHRSILDALRPMMESLLPSDPQPGLADLSDRAFDAPWIQGGDFLPLEALPSAPAGERDSAETSSVSLMRYCHRRSSQPQVVKRIARASSPEQLASWLSVYRDVGGAVGSVVLPGGYEWAGEEELAAIEAVLGDMDAPVPVMVRGREQVSVEALERGEVVDLGAAEEEGDDDDSVVAGVMLEPAASVNGEVAPAVGEETPRKAVKKTIWTDREEKLDPFESLGMLRHVAYTLLAHRGYVPKDESIDQMVLEMARKRFGYEPRTSRRGCQFITPRRGLMGFLGGATSLAEEPLR